MTYDPDDSTFSPVRHRLDLIAGDVGRLRRRTDVPAYIFDRLAEHIATLDAMLCRSAAALVTDGLYVDDALRQVDRRASHLIGLLGERDSGAA